ncbi:hypothetical protein ACFY9F_35400 [Streptomyces sp. NPDC012421]|uniref:hypothetical protein n=1 Tax=Streptomyces sp. NPDC012421 TaxID=3364832 RepID=UPI0036EAE222
MTVRDASRDRHRCRVRELTGESGARRHVTVSPSVFLARETRAGDAHGASSARLSTAGDASTSS